MSKFFIAFYMATIPVHFESRYAQVSLQAKGSGKAFALCGEERFTTSGVNTLRWSALWRAQLEVLQIFLRMSKFKS
jgi:hypothetical protein